MPNGTDRSMSPSRRAIHFLPMAEAITSSSSIQAEIVAGVTRRRSEYHWPSSNFRVDEVSFMEVVAKDLRVMDLTAITFCMDNGLPIRVFDLMEPGNIAKALSGQTIGTLVR